MFELPIEIKGLLTFLITQGLKAFFNLIGQDFDKAGAALVALVVGSVVFFIEGLLALVPPESLPLVEAIIGLLVALLSAFGIHYTYAKVRG